MDDRGATYLHSQRTGNPDIFAKDYDNGYWCNGKPGTTSATPRDERGAS